MCGSVKDAVQSVLDATDGDIVGEDSPYFDSLLGHPIEVPPSVRRSVNRVFQSDGVEAADDSPAGSGQNVTTTALRAAREVLGCYEEKVRPRYIERRTQQDGGEDSNRNGHVELGKEDGAKVAAGGGSIILRYEIFLSTLVSASNVNFEDGAYSVRGPAPKFFSWEDDCGSVEADQVKLDGCGGESLICRSSDSASEECSLATIKALCGAIFTISSDVIMLTASDQLLKPSEIEAKVVKASNCQQREARSFVLPVLLRLLSHAVHTLGIYAYFWKRQNSFDKIFGERLSGEHCLDNIFETFAFVTLAATAFTGGSEVKDSPRTSKSTLSAKVLYPSLADDLSIYHSVAFCSFPPVQGSPWGCLLDEINDGCDKDEDYLLRPAVNLDDVSVHSQWQDTANGVGQRAGMDLLNAVLTSAGAFVEKNDRVTSVFENQQDWALLRRITHAVGRETMARVTRAHFYGRFKRLSRDASDTTKRSASGAVMSFQRKPVVTTPTRRPWYSPHHSAQDLTNNVPEAAAHNRIPSRVLSCLYVMCSFRFPDVVSPVLDDLLPICYTFIDSHDTTHQALGAAALMHLIKESTPTAFAPHKELSGKVLELGCRICRDAAALAILSRARAALFENFAAAKGPDTASSLAAPRRKTTSDLLALVRTQRGDDKTLLAGVLIGGINILLGQHADLPNADAMELLRSGLTTLLPLIRWDGRDTGSRAVQLAALAGLTSLLMGAHPLAPRHGGKIMAEVLSCLGRAERDLAIGEKVRGGANLRSGNDFREHIAAKAVSALALHVASVVLVLCGERAESVLLAIEEGGYESSLVRLCSSVRHGSKMILEEETSQHHMKTES